MATSRNFIGFALVNDLERLILFCDGFKFGKAVASRCRRAIGTFAVIFQREHNYSERASPLLSRKSAERLADKTTRLCTFPAGSSIVENIDPHEERLAQPYGESSVSYDEPYHAHRIADCATRIRCQLLSQAIEHCFQVLTSPDEDVKTHSADQPPAIALTQRPACPGHRIRIPGDRA